MEISEEELSSIDCKRDGAPFVVENVAESQLSVAIIYGGCWLDNHRYDYFQETGRLVRRDVVQAVKRLRREQKKERGERLAKKQMNLFNS